VNRGVKDGHGISALLRERTRAEHEATEAVVARRGFFASRDRYREYLRHFYGIHRVVDAPLARALERAGLADARDRAKARLLAEDLVALGDEPAEVEALPRIAVSALPDLADTLQAVGAAYVLEGASLGGRVILRSVGRALGVADGPGAAFLTGYGEATRARWMTFRQFMDELVVGPEAAEVVVAAAKTTFGAVRACLDGRESGERGERPR